jgi:hypothetical protein
MPYMDKFSLITGIIGLVLAICGVIIFISSLVRVFRKSIKIRNFFLSLVVFLILAGFGSSFIFLSLFIQTFSRYTHEERIGKVYADDIDGTIRVYFFDEKNDRDHFFNLAGDQWMVEGYILRWSTLVRWLGAGSYYRVTRFRGRWEEVRETMISEYQLYPERAMWKFLLKHGKRIPFVDAVYGIGAFQYPCQDTFYIHINDTGFILRSAIRSRH